MEALFLNLFSTQNTGNTELWLSALAKPVQLLRETSLLKNTVSGSIPSTPATWHQSTLCLASRDISVSLVDFLDKMRLTPARMTSHGGDRPEFVGRNHRQERNRRVFESLHRLRTPTPRSDRGSTNDHRDAIGCTGRQTFVDHDHSHLAVVQTGEVESQCPRHRGHARTTLGHLGMRRSGG